MGTMKTIRRVLLGSLSAAALIGAVGIPAQARAQDDLIVVEQALATTQLNGGVGADDEQLMRKVAKDWPLRMIFSERKDSEFVEDVNLLLTDMRGTPYLQVASAGPMTYAMLPAGKYRITARFKGQSETREVTLDGKNGRDVYFHRKGSVKKGSYDGAPAGGVQTSG